MNKKEQSSSTYFAIYNLADESYARIFTLEKRVKQLLSCIAKLEEDVAGLRRETTKQGDSGGRK